MTIKKLKINKPTKTKSYLVPCLTPDILIRKGNLLNAYLSDENKESNYTSEAHLYLLYKYDAKFSEYEAYLESHDLFIEKYDVGNEVMFIFKIPEEHMSDYYKFLEGKYSELSNNLKTKIHTFWKLNKTNKVSMVLRKAPALRKSLENSLEVQIPENAELSSIPNIDSETYK